MHEITPGLRDTGGIPIAKADHTQRKFRQRKNHRCKGTAEKAEKWYHRRPSLLLSQDVVRRDMLKVKDGPHTEAILLLMELLKYGYAHNEITILEGILYADWYRPLFELARRLYGDQIYAWYFDLPFEETLRRHQDKAKLP